MNRIKFKNIIIKNLNSIVELRNKSRFLLRSTHKKYIQKKYKLINGYYIDFDNPVTFTEKIQWLKLFGSLENFSAYVDKFEVRSYVKEKIGENYLIPKIGVYKSANDITLELLPTRFIIKATHGSGWNLIVRDKSKLDWNMAKQQIDKWVKQNYYYFSGERNYKSVKGRVIIEQLIEDVKEYKFYCYHGQPRFVVVIKVTESNTRQKEYYDLNWNKLNMNIGGPTNTAKGARKPQHYNEMIEISRKLSSQFSFVRVDLYYSKGQIYFGELTFTPNNGFGKFSDVKYDELFGEHLKVLEV